MRKAVDDDLDLGLPPMDGDTDSEPEAVSGDKEELLPGQDKEGETVGLDDEAGVDSQADQQDLISDLNIEEGEGSILESDAAGELSEGGLDLPEGEGEKWTQDSEAEENDWELDESECFAESDGAGDHGEEGIVEVSEPRGEDDDPMSQPPLRSTDEDEMPDDGEDEAFGLKLLGELAGKSLDSEEKIEVAPGVIWERIPRDLVAVRLLPVLGLPRLAIKSAAVDRKDERIVAVGTDTDVYRSRDGGKTFEPTSAPDPVGDATDREPAVSGLGEPRFEVAFTVDEEERSRLWASAPRGALLYSRDLGNSWELSQIEARALGVASDGRDNFAVLSGANRASPRSVRVVSARGRSWSKIALPETAERSVCHLAVCRGVLLAVCRPSGEILAKAGAESWKPLPRGASWPAALVEEDDEVAAYLCVPLATDNVLVARWPIFPALRTPLVALSMDEMPKALCAVYTDGITSLDIATGRAWRRATISRTAG